MTITDPGYSIHDRVFDRSEMAQLLEALNSADIERTKAGARHVLTQPSVRELANDQRLMTLASEFVGPAPVPFRATLFDKSANALAGRLAPGVPAGGVVAMRPLTIHASSKSLDDRPRRVLQIEYATAAAIGPGVELARPAYPTAAVWKG